MFYTATGSRQPAATGGFKALRSEKKKWKKLLWMIARPKRFTTSRINSACILHTIYIRIAIANRWITFQFCGRDWLPLALYACKFPFAREREREREESWNGIERFGWVYLSVMALRKAAKTIEDSRLEITRRNWMAAGQTAPPRTDFLCSVDEDEKSKLFRLTALLMQ